MRTKLLMSLLLLGLAAGCEKKPAMPTPLERYAEAMGRLTAAKTTEDRFYALNDAEKEAFNVGKAAEAGKFAEEQAALLPKFKKNWNYGNAVQDVNLVLGRIAVSEGRMEEAKQYLLKSAASEGSPQMNSFGPNMSLAQDLLAAGQRDVVQQYFKLCAKFWKMDNGKLKKWSEEVQAGRAPDFGANLYY